MDPYKLKIFDELGIKHPDIGGPNYGQSLIGTPEVEIMRYANSPIITLNLMFGLDGIVYTNTVDGSSNALTFLNFFFFNVYLPDGQPAFSYNNHVIFDNYALRQMTVLQFIFRPILPSLILQNTFSTN